MNLLHYAKRLLLSIGIITPPSPETKTDRLQILGCGERHIFIPNCGSLSIWRFPYFPVSLSKSNYYTYIDALDQFSQECSDRINTLLVVDKSSEAILFKKHINIPASHPNQLGTFTYNFHIHRKHFIRSDVTDRFAFGRGSRTGNLNFCLGNSLIDPNDDEIVEYPLESKFRRVQSSVTYST